MSYSVFDLSYVPPQEPIIVGNQQIPVLNENLIFFLHEPEDGETAVVNPAVAQPVMEALTRRNCRLDYILNTHRHSDHTGANLHYKADAGC